MTCQKKWWRRNSGRIPLSRQGTATFLVAVSIQPKNKEEQDADSVEIKIKDTIEEEE